MTDELVERCYLYRFFDLDERLLYVGITRDVGSRFSDHRRSSGWWSEVATCAIETTPGRAEAEYAEAVAILAERPLHNTAQPSVHGTRERVRTHGIDVVRLVAEVERMRRESAEWRMRAIVAEAAQAAGWDAGQSMRENLRWARSDVRQTDALLAEVQARRSLETMSAQREDTTVLAGEPGRAVGRSDWGDEL